MKPFKGIVISDQPDKTIIVKVSRIKKHRKYEKRFSVHKNYSVHDPDNRYKIGDQVEFIPCPPISKNKKFKVLS